MAAMSQVRDARQTDQTSTDQTLTDHPLTDQTGRELGERARNTRQRLLEATSELLGKRSLRELRVVDIARAVGNRRQQ